MQENNNQNSPNNPVSPQAGRADYGGYTQRMDFRRPAPANQATPVKLTQQDMVQQASVAAQRMVDPSATPAPVAPSTASQQLQERPELSTSQSASQLAPAPIQQASPTVPTPVAPATVAPLAPIAQESEQSRRDQFAPPPKQKNKLSLKLPSFRKAATIAGVLILVGGAFGVFQYVRSGDGSLPSVAGVNETKTQDDEGGLLVNAKPHEDGNPPSVEYYRTADSYPKVIRVPKMNIESRILPLSIAPTGALKSPATIFDAGWYKDSARIGEQGAMVINGHTAGEYNKGIFYNLNTLKKGDQIEVEAGSGKKFTYTVQETVTYKADELDMSRVMIPYKAGATSLTLINTGGRVDPATEYFEDRVVVFAVL